MKAWNNIKLWRWRKQAYEVFKSWMNVKKTREDTSTTAPKPGDFITVKRHRQDMDKSYVGRCLKVVSVAYPNLIIIETDEFWKKFGETNLNLTDWEIIPWGMEEPEELVRKAAAAYKGNPPIDQMRLDK